MKITVENYHKDNKLELNITLKKKLRNMDTKEIDKLWKEIISQIMTTTEKKGEDAWFIRNEKQL